MTLHMTPVWVTCEEAVAVNHSLPCLFMGAHLTYYGIFLFLFLLFLLFLSLFAWLTLALQNPLPADPTDFSLTFNKCESLPPFIIVLLNSLGERGPRITSKRRLQHSRIQDHNLASQPREEVRPCGHLIFPSFFSLFPRLGTFLLALSVASCISQHVGKGDTWPLCFSSSHKRPIGPSQVYFPFSWFFHLQSLGQYELSSQRACY